MDQLTSMRVFVQTVDRGSIAAAARALQMSQSMAAKHLNALEARLRSQLLLRTTRKLTLTEDGQRHLDFCRKILADIDAEEGRFLDQQTDVSGVLRISAPVAFGQLVLSKMLGPFLARYTALRVEINLNDRRVNLVDEGWDMAIRVGTLQDDSLRARKLAQTRGILAASPDYVARHGRPRTAEDLRSHDVLGYTLSERIGVRHWQLGSRASDRVAVEPRVISNSGEVLVEAAKAGLGLVVYPEYLLRPELAAGRLVELEFDGGDAIPPLGIHAVYPALRQTPAKVRAMIDYLLDAFREGIEVSDASADIAAKKQEQR